MINIWDKIKAFPLLRISTITLAVILTLIIGSLAGGYLYFTSKDGRQWLVLQINQGLKDQDSGIKIDNIEGSIFAGFSIPVISVFDPDGVWLEFHQTTIDWSPLQLIQKRIVVRDMRVQNTHLYRRPNLKQAPDHPANIEDNQPISLPSLPIDIDVTAFTLSMIDIDKGFAGKAAQFLSNGTFKLTDTDGVDVHLKLINKGKGKDEITLNLTYPGANNINANHDLVVDMSLKAPKGGMFALLAGIKSEQDVLITLNGTGPIEDWSGAFDAHIGATNIASATVRHIGKSLSVRAKLDAGDIELDMATALLGKTATLSFDLKPTETADKTDLSLDLIAQTIHLSANGFLRASDVGASDKVNFRLEVTDAEPFNQLISPAKFKPFTAKGIISDLTRDPKITLTLDPISLSYATGITGEFQGNIEASSQKGIFTFQGMGRLDHINGDWVSDVKPLVKDGVAWDAKGQIDEKSEKITFNHLSLKNALLSLLGQGAFETKTGLYSAKLEGHLPDTAVLLPDVAGKANFTAHVKQTSTAAPLQIKLMGNAQNLKLGQALLNDIMGAAPTAAATFERTSDGTITLKDISLKAKHLDLTAKAKIAPDDILSKTDFKLKFFDIEKLESLKDLYIKGGFDVTGTLSGPLSSPSLVMETALKKLDIEHLKLRDFQARLIAETITPTLSATLQIESASNFGPLKAKIDFTGDTGPESKNTTETRYAVPDLEIALGPYHAKGALTATAGKPAVGLITLSTDPTPKKGHTANGPYTALKGLILGTINFNDQEDKQQISLKGTVSNLSLTMAQTDTVTLKNGVISGRILITDATPELTLDAQLTDLMHPRIQASDMHLTLDQKDTSLAYNMHVTGTNFMPYDLTLGGTIWPEELPTKNHKEGQGQRIELRLEGTLDKTKISLEKPLSITLAPNGIDLKPFILNLGDGHISGSLYRQKDILRLDFTAEKADLRPSAIYLPEIPLTGLLSGMGHLAMTADKVDGTFSLNLSSIALVNQTIKLDDNLQISAKGTLSKKDITLSGAAQLADDFNAEFSAKLPVNIDARQAQLSIPDDKPIYGLMTWQGKIGTIWPILDLINHDLSGDVDANLNLSGTIKTPDLDGHIKLKEGRYENAPSGFVAADIDMLATISDRHLVLEHFKANDGENGLITAKADINFHPDFTYDAKADLELNHAHIIRLPKISTTASSLLTFKKHDTTRSLTGKITVENADIGAVTQGNADIIEVDVREINAEGKENNGLENKGEILGPIALDLTLKAPKRLFIRSYGLDSEWAADLKITNTFQEPVIAGTASLVRGVFEFSGKRFTLTRGKLTMPNNRSNDPELDITAEHKLIDLVAILHITGPASAPVIAITSSPSLPQDEILSRILFGTSLSELSAIEAVQLAAAIRSLSNGGGPGFIGGVRNALGIDRLSIDKANADTYGTTITGGKYLTNNIYVEVTTSPATGETATSVEVSLTRRLSVITRRTMAQDNSLALRWSWRY